MATFAEAQRQKAIMTDHRTVLNVLPREQPAELFGHFAGWSGRFEFFTATLANHDHKFSRRRWPEA